VPSLPPEVDRAGGLDLIFATDTNKQRAKTWMQLHEPNRGGTIIDVPVAQALTVLERCNLLPFIVLITDGAVANERDICRDIEQQKSLRTRFLTLGIGSYCNWFFLKMLSQIGKGFSDVVVFREHIYHKIDHLLRMAGVPILTDIELEFKANSVEMHPNPVPDLFAGAPLLVAARYKSTLDDNPSEIIITGSDPYNKKKLLNVKLIHVMICLLIKYLLNNKLIY